MNKLVFKGSLTRGIVKGANILTPDVIEICGDTMTYRKRSPWLVSNHQKVVSLRRITAVHVKNTLWGSNLHIHTGGEWIVAEHFTRKDAREIQRLLTSYV